MHMKCIFGFLLLLSVVQFKIILGLTASKGKFLALIPLGTWLKFNTCFIAIQKI